MHIPILNLCAVLLLLIEINTGAVGAGTLIEICACVYLLVCVCVCWIERGKNDPCCEKQQCTSVLHSSSEVQVVPAIFFRFFSLCRTSVCVCVDFDVMPRSILGRMRKKESRAISSQCKQSVLLILQIAGQLSAVTWDVVILH